MAEPIKFTEGLKLSRIDFCDDEGSAYFITNDVVKSDVRKVESIVVSMQSGPGAMIPWAVVRFSDGTAPAMVNLSFIESVNLLESP